MRLVAAFDDGAAAPGKRVDRKAPNALDEAGRLLGEIERIAGRKP